MIGRADFESSRRSRYNLSRYTIPERARLMTSHIRGLGASNPQERLNGAELSSQVCAVACNEFCRALIEIARKVGVITNDEPFGSRTGDRIKRD